MYAIDAAGNIVKKYNTLRAAAYYTGRQPVFVWKRANGQILGNEFQPDGVTFRYAAQWDAMTVSQRRADVERARQVQYRKEKKHSGHSGASRTVVVIDRRGHEVGRYPGIKQAWEATGNGVSYPVVAGRCTYRYAKSPYARNGYAYRYADDWDNMTEEQRREFLRIDT